MNGAAWLQTMTKKYDYYKKMCERAIAQVNDQDFFTPLAGNPNSLAIVIKHLGGNHRSRWRDFLTSDGEKDDRNRDWEFVVGGETRQSVMAVWEDGWQITFDELARLSDADLEREITIRGEPMTVVEAMVRNMNHLAYHAGQVVHLARQFAGDRWESMSIPVGESEKFNQKMRDKFGEWRG